MESMKSKSVLDDIQRFQQIPKLNLLQIINHLSPMELFSIPLISLILMTCLSEHDPFNFTSMTSSYFCHNQSIRPRIIIEKTRLNNVFESYIKVFKRRVQLCVIILGKQIFHFFLLSVPVNLVFRSLFLLRRWSPDF